MYNNIIWDFDGTIFDTYPAMTAAMHETLIAHAISASYDEVYSLMKKSVSDTTEYFSRYTDTGKEFMDEYVARRRALEAELSVPYPGMAELLRDITASGRSNYIFTHRGSTLVSMLERYSLSDLFVECVSSLNGFPRKPAPDGIDYLTQKYSLQKSETVIVGDRELDILSGKAAGIATIAFIDGTGADIEIADHKVNSVTALRELLLGNTDK